MPFCAQQDWLLLFTFNEHILFLIKAPDNANKHMQINQEHFSWLVSFLKNSLLMNGSLIILKY